MTPYQLAIQQINQKYAGTTTTSAPPPGVGYGHQILNAINPVSPTNVGLKINNAYQNFTQNLQSHLASLGQDALNTLVVNPATRIAQAGVQTSNEFQNPGYSTPVDTGNPQRAGAGGTVAPLPSPTQTPQVNTSNSESNVLTQPQTPLGAVGGTVSNGNVTPKQIAGQGLKAASYLAAPELAGETGGMPTMAGKMVLGGAGGTLIGATGSAGNELANNPNANFQTVTNAVGQGEWQGAAAGTLLAGAGGLLQIGAETPLTETTPTPTETPVTQPTDATLQSRINDATPSYKSVLKKGDITGQIKTPDTVDAQGNTIPGEKINRVDEGKGLLGNRKVNPTTFETANGTELNNVPNYPDKGTFLEKSQATQKAISTEATSYKAGLAAEDKANPLVTDVAKNQVYKNVFDNLNGDARDAFLGKQNKLLSQAGQPIEIPKSIVGRYGQDIAEATSKYDGTRLGLQTLKEDFETAYQDARGKSAYGTEQRNGIDEMNSALRDYLKKELSSSTKNTDVLASLDKQAKLYRANDVLQNKAEVEATSKFDRYLQAHPMIKKIGTRGLMRIAIEVTGISLAAATINKLIKTATSGK